MIRCGGYTMIRRLVTGLLVGLIVSGCQTLGLTDSDEREPKPAVKTAAGTPSVQQWRIDIGPSTRLAGLEPMVVDEHVYVASESGTVMAVTLDGATVWTAKTGFDIYGGVGADEQMVVAGGKKGEIIALETETGKKRWQVTIRSEIPVPPIVTPSVVAIRTLDGRIFGLTHAEGKRKWIYQRILPSLILRSAAPMIRSGNYVFVGYPGGKLVALHHDKGAVIFEENISTPRGDNELERLTDISSRVVIHETQFCASAYQGRVGCFNLRNGQPVWFKELSASAGIAMDEKAVYVASDDGYLYALDRDIGTEQWKVEVLAGDPLVMPVISNDYLVVGDSFGFLHFFKRDTGEFAGRFSVDGTALTAPPVVLQDGSIIVQTTGGKVTRYSVSGG